MGDWVAAWLQWIGLLPPPLAIAIAVALGAFTLLLVAGIVKFLLAVLHE